MARHHTVAALTAAVLFLVVALHLLANVRLQDLGFRKLRDYAADQYPQIVISSTKAEDGDEEGLPQNTQYLVGVGKADITGPVVEINMMGYADPNQLGSGLRQRLYSRAFIVGSKENLEDRFAYLVLDTQSGDTAVRYGILQALAELGPAFNVYKESNVAVTGTHSHSGPGGWLNYLLPQITSKGFNKQSYQAIVDGAVLSIQRAHQQLQPGYLSTGTVEVEDANVNRSPFAYLANPKEERDEYSHDVDKTLTMLKFQSAKNGKNLGVLTWFPVHGTSMLGNNTLISGDNKGVAAHLFEQSVRKSEDAAEGFVAGFSQANVGDTSPNILGAYCESGESEGQRCNFEDSTCDGRNEPCHARGPFFREKDEGASSCYEIGRRQFAAAKTLYDSMNDASSPSSTPISGPTVKSFHTFRDFSNFTFTLPNGTLATTCPAALGYSFAAGTTDGPGAFDFKQNSTTGNSNPVWALVRGFLHEPSAAQNACHAPKPILLDVGEITRPYLWTPNVVDIQLLRVGQFLIIVSPGEATTMAGRRWKSAIATVAKTHLDLPLTLPLTTTNNENHNHNHQKSDPIVVLGGPANTYTHYIATAEEYSIQRYEGASTLYGPQTLAAHINLTVSYLPLLHSHPPSSLPIPPITPPIYPPINTNDSLSFITPVLADLPGGLFRSFGDVLEDVKPAYERGDTVSVRFVGGNPRNDLRLESTYAAVERRVDGKDGEGDGEGEWETVRTDADWDLVFRWRRTSTVLATSEVVIEWEIGKGDGGDGVEEVEGGLYRVRYFGAAKSALGGGVSGFEGVSGAFEVV